MEKSIEQGLIKINNSISHKETGTIITSAKADHNGYLHFQLSEGYNFPEGPSYIIDLIYLQIVAFFPNVNENNNRFYYTTTNSDTIKEIKLDESNLDVEEYGKEIKNGMVENGDNPDAITISLIKGSGKVRINISHGYKIYFNSDRTWQGPLGFDDVILEEGIHKSNRKCNMTPTRMVHFAVDLVDNKCVRYEGKKSNIIFSFSADLVYGRLVEFRPKIGEARRKLSKLTFDDFLGQLFDDKNKPVKLEHTTVHAQFNISH